MSQKTISNTADAINFIKALPPFYGRGKHWASAVDGCAALVAFLNAQHNRKAAILHICDAAKVGAYALENLCRGAFTSGNPWPELKAKIEAEVAKRNEAITEKVKAIGDAAPAPAQTANASKGALEQWRMGDSGDIVVTSSRVLKYGTPEHSAFLRRVLPECGTVRA